MQRNRFKLSKKERAALIILSVAAVFWIAFIFSNSLKSSEVSGNDSGRVVRFIIERVFGKDFYSQSEEFVSNVDFFVRKAAHFAEFAVLSFLVYFINHIIKFTALWCVFTASLTALVAGCIDETLQLFSSGRACRFTDVLIDSAGGIAASCFAMLLVKTVAYIKNKRGFDE